MYDNMAPDHMKVLLAYYDGKPISGVIPIFYGNKTWYLYGASSNEHRNLMPNYLLQWEMIKLAISRHDDIYDFRGVSGVVDENHPQYGLYRFKKDSEQNLQNLLEKFIFHSNQYTLDYINSQKNI